MSQIAGGRADKCGNAFERLWIVYLSLEVVEGSATSIKWEPLGPEGTGIECVVTRPNGTKEMHQFKINNGTDGKWTSADLAKILAAAKVHLESDSNARFLSGQSPINSRSFVYVLQPVVISIDYCLIDNIARGGKSKAVARCCY